MNMYHSKEFALKKMLTVKSIAVQLVDAEHVNQIIMFPLTKYVYLKSQDAFINQEDALTVTHPSNSTKILKNVELVDAFKQPAQDAKHADSLMKLQILEFAEFLIVSQLRIMVAEDVHLDIMLKMDFIVLLMTLTAINIMRMETVKHVHPDICL